MYKTINGFSGKVIFRKFPVPIVLDMQAAENADFFEGGGLFENQSEITEVIQNMLRYVQKSQNPWISYFHPMPNSIVHIQK